jgi:CubicO group peptidase (beta-lactamase class C family)
MNKPMTAIAIMQLVQEGKVRLGGKVSDYLAFYPKETGTRITVEQLLNHTSGIRQDIGFGDDPSPGPGIVAAINADQLSNDSLVKLIARRPLLFEPGTRFAYSSDAYAVLGAIVEHVSGRPYWQALRERVLDRAGMTETGVSLLRPVVPRRAGGYAQTFGGYENAPHIGVTPAGGLYSTLRDLRRFVGSEKRFNPLGREVRRLRQRPDVAAIERLVVLGAASHRPHRPPAAGTHRHGDRGAARPARPGRGPGCLRRDVGPPVRAGAHGGPVRGLDRGLRRCAGRRPRRGHGGDGRAGQRP